MIYQYLKWDIESTSQLHLLSAMVSECEFVVVVVLPNMELNFSFLFLVKGSLLSPSFCPDSDTTLSIDSVSRMDAFSSSKTSTGSSVNLHLFLNLGSRKEHLPKSKLTSVPD